MTSTSDVVLELPSVALGGILTLPAEPDGIVVFAHGSGSSRHSSRNRYVARVLASANLGTLLFDLLTTTEERDRGNVFDVALLASRLGDATTWLREDRGVDLPVGYFGASTGAAAALVAAAQSPRQVAAVVSRGGRPDLAGSWLPTVASPTLLVVGSLDRVVLDLNEKALAMMQCKAELEIVPGATHLFEEPGTLDAAAELARDWFARFVGGENHTPPDSA